nr:hypothetical protein [Tanacetum cinerariifolium]
MTSYVLALCAILSKLRLSQSPLYLLAISSSLKHQAKKKKHEGPRKTSSWASVPPLLTFAPKGVGKHLRVLAHYLESSEASPNPFILDVQEAYSTHNVLFGLHCPSFKNKLDSLSLDFVANVYDVHALHLVVVVNMLTNESRVVSWYRIFTKDKNQAKTDKIEHGMERA